MKYCQFCKFWKQTTNYNSDRVVDTGKCTELVYHLVLELNQGCDFVEIESIETNGDFGCIKFEKDETEV